MNSPFSGYQYTCWSTRRWCFNST